MLSRLWQQGLTLIEVLVATFIISASLVGLLIFGLYFSRSYDFSFEETIAIAEAERAIKLMVKEIREARDGEDGSYPLSVVNDQELVFFSDIDNDGQTERVRYYLVGTQLVKQVFYAGGNPPLYNCVGSCTVCHKPGSENQTIVIAEPAWPAHQAHGDTLGACGQGGGSQSGEQDSERIVVDYVRNGSLPIFSSYNENWPADQLNNPLTQSPRLLGAKLVQVKLKLNVNPNKIPDDFDLSTFVNLRNLKTNL